MEKEIVIIHKKLGAKVSPYRAGGIYTVSEKEARELVESGLAIYRPGGGVETASLSNRAAPQEQKTLAANAEEKKKRGRPKKEKVEE